MNDNCNGTECGECEKCEEILARVKNFNKRKDNAIKAKMTARKERRRNGLDP